MFSILKRFGVVPFVKADTEEDVLAIAKALTEGGLPVMELVFHSFVHGKAIRRIAREMPEFMIGAGNILNKDQLVRATESGAKFAFSPGSDPDTIAEAGKRNIIYGAGVCTPTEIQCTLIAGASDIQFFPAEGAGGLEMLKTIVDPFLHLGIEVFAKGGITPEKALEYLRFSPVAAVSAPWIVTPAMVRNKDWASVTREAGKAVKLFESLQG